MTCPFILLCYHFNVNIFEIVSMRDPSNINIRLKIDCNGQIKPKNSGIYFYR